MKQLAISMAVCLAIATGCSGYKKHDAVVTGTVLVDGELANSGIVTFHPVDGGNVSVGRIHTDGSYSLRTGQGNLRKEDGGTVASGDYVVTVTISGPSVASAQVVEGGPPIPGPSLVAAKYASAETSDLKHTVKPGEQVIVLELERAEAAPAEVIEVGEEEVVTGDAATTDAETEAPPAAAEQPDSAGVESPSGASAPAPEDAATSAEENPQS
jgi:hypothetical protein